jgi:hypothetical protein
MSKDIFKRFLKESFFGIRLSKYIFFDKNGLFSFGAKK